VGKEMSRYIFDKRLPKAKLFSVKWGGYNRKPYFAKFRGANFVRWQLWYICIVYRAPWQREIAEVLHPHLFKEKQ